MERWPLFFLWIWVLLFSLFLPISLPLHAEEAIKEPREKLITLDFNNVDLPVFVKFISELTGKNFVIDERVKGKVTIFAPSKITLERAYDVFLSVLELKGFTAVPTSPSAETFQIMPLADAPPERNVNVYTLANTNAEDMAKVLLGLVTRAPTPPRKGAHPTGEISGTVQVLADKTTNSLIITATPPDYEVLKKVIEQLDAKRRQVFVEAVILEVSLDKLRQLGTTIGAAFGYEFGSSVTAFGGFNAQPADFANIGVSVPNVALAPLNVKALMQFLQSSSDVNILSTPQLLTSDNQKAEITVGQNIPIPGSQTTSVGGNITTTIERRDVGVILRLTPQVLDNNLVRLDVYQEISSLVNTPQVVGNIVLGPTTNKRTANTTVVAISDQTVVIGGLIQDNVTKSDSKVPLLGDIPILGYLFRSESREVIKTNLLIFLTPHVIRDRAETEAIKIKAIDQMDLLLRYKKDEFREPRMQFLRGMVDVPGSR